jgi:hypothetical protein
MWEGCSKTGQVPGYSQSAEWLDIVKYGMVSKQFTAIPEALAGVSQRFSMCQFIIKIGLQLIKACILSGIPLCRMLQCFYRLFYVFLYSIQSGDSLKSRQILKGRAIRIKK